MSIKRVISSLAVAIGAALALCAAEPITLPHGSKITPSGAFTPLATLPLRIVANPDKHWYAVLNGGFGMHGVFIVDSSAQVRDRVLVLDAYSAIDFSRDGKELLVGTSHGLVSFTFDEASGKLGTAKRLAIPYYSNVTNVTALAGGKVLLATSGRSPDGKLGRRFEMHDATGALLWAVPLDARPFSVIPTPDGSLAYVSEWLTPAITAIDLATGRTIANIATPLHPTALALTSDGRRLYATCSATNLVLEIDTKTMQIAGQIDVGLFTGLLPGSTPDALALSRDDSTLYVANADNNDVAVVNTNGDAPRVVGSIPVGWYPTDLVLSSDEDALFVLDGKGLGQHDNKAYAPYTPTNLVASDADPLEGSRGYPMSYGGISTFFVANIEVGGVERVPLRGFDLAQGLAQARSNSTYRPGATLAALPPIKHVIYVIKENRTYDQVLGDDPSGNGDASLAMFGRNITPNIHKLADDFVLADNYYLEGEVSENGWPYALTGYSSDSIERNWPADYGGQPGPDLGIDAQTSPGEYIWQDALAHNVSVRLYHLDSISERQAGSYAPPMSRSVVGDWNEEGPNDESIVDFWLREFRGYEQRGDLPALEILGLGGDHTQGTIPFHRTPRAFVATNDHALARLVEAVSHSRYWKDTVIFVTEDDAQNGPDHVSAQRSYLLVAGGYVKRHFVDHTRYSMMSILRTIEEIFGLPPLTQLDAWATPFNAMFSTAPVLDAFTAEKPRIDVSELNSPLAVDARVSSYLRFDRPDENDPAVLNRILWDDAMKSGEIPRDARPPATMAFDREPDFN